MKILKGLLWLNVTGMFGYLMVILAMIYGWGRSRLVIRPIFGGVLFVVLLTIRVI
jgi:hypothetical protein